MTRRELLATATLPVVQPLASAVAAGQREDPSKYSLSQPLSIRTEEGALRSILWHCDKQPPESGDATGYENWWMCDLHIAGFVNTTYDTPHVFIYPQYCDRPGIARIVMDEIERVFPLLHYAVSIKRKEDQA